MFQATSQAATQAMAYSVAAGITSLIVLIGAGIYVLVRWLMGLAKHSHSEPDESVSEPESDTISETNSAILAEAAAKSLQLNTAALKAAKRMNDAVSEYKSTEF